jgi:hypothetical protein
MWHLRCGPLSDVLRGLVEDDPEFPGQLRFDLPERGLEFLHAANGYDGGDLPVPSAR